MQTSNQKLHISELLYYLMLLCFMGTKAVGLDESQWPFWIAILLGGLFFLTKLIMTRYSITEWVINATLLALGITVLARNGHLEVLLAVTIIVGIKGVYIKRAMKVSLIIWGPLFCATVIRALFGIRPGYISTQMKVGIDYGVIRYSLGFTHPNVLHITFFLVVMLILYCTSVKGKRLYLLSLLLFAMNVYVFLYSLSYTGFIVVSICLIVNILLSKHNKGKLVVQLVSLLVCLLCFIMPVIGQYILPDSLLTIINRLINQRFMWAGKAFMDTPLSLFGSTTTLTVPSLDSSYAYILFYHGLIVFGLYLLGYLYSVLRAIRDNRRQDVSLLISMGISGITEQYMGNISLKNVSLLLIGDNLYNYLLPKFNLRIANCILRRKDISSENIPFYIPFSLDGEISMGGLHSLKIRVKRYFKGTQWLRCILPAILITILANIIFSIVWIEPKMVYKVVTDGILESEPIIYNESTHPEFNSKEVFVIGELKDGCIVTALSWVDTRTETTRGRISVSVWSFIFGYMVIAFILNIRKLSNVYIEEPILDDETQIPNMPTCKILGVNVAITNMQHSVNYLRNNIEKLQGKYICVSNVHTITMSHRDSDYLNVQNGAAIVLPDGKPLSYVARRRGFIQADRVAGPDLMEEIFKISAKEGYRHYFFGSTVETLHKLQDKLESTYPGINIVGTYSPNYYKNVDDIPQSEDDEHIRLIREAKPHFIWIGLGAPKQEIWMSKHSGMFDGIMIGVGAGFDFHAGTVKRAPKIIQTLYLEWLYRLVQDPKRLFKRYFSTNMSFVLATVKERKSKTVPYDVSEKKKLLIYAHYYAPDVASTGQILTELAEGMLNTFDITVIAVVPSYKGIIEEKYRKYHYYQQDVRGVKVYRVRVPEFVKTRKLSRAVNIITYYIRARKITKKVGSQDYVMSISQPPILGGMLGCYGSKIKQAKFIYNIQDFNPEQTMSVGYSKSKFILWLMMKLDIRSCSRADLVITVGRDLMETLEKRFDNKVVPPHIFINNWIDEKKVYPTEDENVNAFKTKYGLNNKFVFMYSGNIGLYYDLENLMQIIKTIPSDTKTESGKQVVFAFVGDGSLKDKLSNYVEINDMKNVIFIPYQDKDVLNYSLNSGDVHICVNAMGIKGVSCPSKYYGIASVGKPILASLEKGSEIRCIIEETEGGLVSDPMDNEALYNNIMKFIDIADTGEMTAMGMRGRNNLLNNLTKDISIQKYIEGILSC